MSEIIEMPTGDDRRSEGYQWCRRHGEWYFINCDKCSNERLRETKGEV